MSQTIIEDITGVFYTEQGFIHSYQSSIFDKDGKVHPAIEKQHTFLQFLKIVNSRAYAYNRGRVQLGKKPINFIQIGWSDRKMAYYIEIDTNIDHTEHFAEPSTGEAQTEPKHLQSEILCLFNGNWVNDAVRFYCDANDADKSYLQYGYDYLKGRMAKQANYGIVMVDELV